MRRKRNVSCIVPWRFHHGNQKEQLHCYWSIAGATWLLAPEDFPDSQIHVHERLQKVFLQPSEWLHFRWKGQGETGKTPEFLYAISHWARKISKNYFRGFRYETETQCLLHSSLKISPRQSERISQAVLLIHYGGHLIIGTRGFPR
jgi:hypothetical protein